MNFDSLPILKGKVLADGTTLARGAPTGAAGDENILMFPEGTLEWHVIGTQTLLGPRLVATGLDVQGAELKAVPTQEQPNSTLRPVELEQPRMAVGGGFSRTGVQFEWEVKTLGWQPTCKCNADKVPSIVLDPFAGAGTTLWVAKKLGRKSIGFDTSEEYCELNRKRNEQQVLI